MAKVKFTKSPAGRFKLAYFAGEEAELSAEQAALVIGEGFAVPIAKKVKAADKKAAEAKAKAEAEAKAKAEAEAAAAAEDPDESAASAAPPAGPIKAARKSKAKDSKES